MNICRNESIEIDLRIRDSVSNNLFLEAHLTEFDICLAICSRYSACVELRLSTTFHANWNAACCLIPDFLCVRISYRTHPNAVRGADFVRDTRDTHAFADLRFEADHVIKTFLGYGFARAQVYA